jgi:hypothetical protein
MVEIKAIVVQGTADVLREHLGERRHQEVLDRLKGEARALFRDRLPALQPMAWVELDTFAQFLEEYVAISEGGRGERLVEYAEEVVERQLTTIYRVYVKLCRPESLIAKAAAMASTYFRGVRVEGSLQEKGRATVRYVGFQKQHHLVGVAIVGFWQKALRLCGAKDVQAVFTQPIEAGEAYAELSIAWH